MGVGFTNTNDWARTELANFNSKLLAAIGVDIMTMEGYSSDVSSRTWSTIDDPVVPFFSDLLYSGELRPEKCLIVASRIRQLLPLIEDQITPWTRDNALELCNAMEETGRAGLVFRFYP